MALGGGTFTSQNKVLPGAYINFISANRATASVGDRGVATMPLELDWGQENEVFTVTLKDFQKDCKRIFGYDFTHDKLKGLRDLFLHCKVLHAYRLNGGGTKATNTFATAKYGGIRGNDIRIAITTNVDDEDVFDVSTYLDTTLVDTQTVTSASELKSNDWVDFKANASLSATSAVALAGGTNKTVTGAEHQSYLDAIESYSFNTIGVVTTDDTTKTLYISFTKRMRDEVGAKFQLVIYNKAADYEGVINLKNKCIDDATVSDGVTTYPNEANAVYWLTGAESECQINKTIQNMKYDGEYEIDTKYTQTQLSAALTTGEFVFHKSSNEVRVLDDVNSLVTVTDEKGEDFKSNQTIRVLDQIAIDVASLFNNKYLGDIPNDADGRTSLWLDLVKYYQELEKLRAIENFNPDTLSVEQGNTHKSVVVSNPVTVVNAMAQLYMTVIVA
ncbi:phage tail sheath family protein [[Clostridium] polysaccharolyticum]|uniref:Phage tail sheath protein n=1 Tax=[Clostridium] polysaccharolyticum TaxID=29364 RepID=A0A1H9YI04_9FIRM|nr:phage tail sheath family protein [[Clostridium] polysaccharolyticum]SES68588.1 Phage tail sheath protein [[Clostridium] polysaccharolyticum]